MKIPKSEYLTNHIVTLQGQILQEEYQGERFHGKKHGHGKRIWNTGHIYEGEWQDGNMSGQGKYIWPDGMTYRGTFLNGQSNGYG